MTTDCAANKATIRLFHDATNTGDLALISNSIDELSEPDALIRTPLPIDATGAQVLKEVLAGGLGVFPDLRVTIEDLIAEEDKVVSRNTVIGDLSLGGPKRLRLSFSEGERHLGRCTRTPPSWLGARLLHRAIGRDVGALEPAFEEAG